VLVNDVAGADAVADEISATGGTACACRASVAVAREARSIVDRVMSEFGHLDIVINNAGSLVLKSFSETSDEEYERTISTHLGGSWHLTRAAWPHMRQGAFGRVLMISSANGSVFATPGHAAYGAAKAAMIGLVRELALEGEADGIHVNALLPGADTALLRANPSSSRPSIDMRPELVAPAACWLVHPDCSANGQLFASSSGRIGRVFTGVAAGYQATPEAFTLESVRDNWETAATAEPFIEPTTVEAYNAFRTALYDGIQPPSRAAH
jgi:NAD(P)-dependent dehydrogenase (short-subunit alcohol dehydrogenase family)